MDERVRKTLDLNRYAEIVKAADLLGNLWASARLAAERGDDACLRLNCQQAAAATKHAFALVKLLGNPDPADG